jgi:hypothetical protein
MKHSRSTLPGATGYEPTDDDRAAVMALVRSVGETEACARLGVDRNALARVAAQLPVREGTLLKFRASLAGGAPVDPAQLSLQLDPARAAA